MPARVPAEPAAFLAASAPFAGVPAESHSAGRQAVPPAEYIGWRSAFAFPVPPADAMRPVRTAFVPDCFRFAADAFFRPAARNGSAEIQRTG